MKMSMKLEGWDGLAKALKGMPDALMIKTIRPAVKDSAQMVANAMKALAPTSDGGYIRKSIFVYSDQSKHFRKYARFNPKTYVSFITGPLKPVVPVDNEGKIIGRGRGGISGKMRKMTGAKMWRPFYAIFFEKGGKAHPIEAKNRQILATQNPKGMRKKHYDGWYFLGKKVNVGAYPWKPFVRPAFDQNVKRVISHMGNELRTGIDKAMK